MPKKSSSRLWVIVLLLMSSSLLLTPCCWAQEGPMTTAVGTMALSFVWDVHQTGATQGIPLMSMTSEDGLVVTIAYVETDNWFDQVARLVLMTDESMTCTEAPTLTTLPAPFQVGHHYELSLAFSTELGELAFDLRDTHQNTQLCAGYLPMRLPPPPLAVSSILAPGPHIVSHQYQRLGESILSSQFDWMFTVMLPGEKPIVTSLRRFSGSDTPGLRLGWPAWPVPGEISVTQLSSGTKKLLYSGQWTPDPVDIAIPWTNRPGASRLQITWSTNHEKHVLGEPVLEMIPGLASVALSMPSVVWGNETVQGELQIMATAPLEATVWSVEAEPPASKPSDVTTPLLQISVPTLSAGTHRLPVSVDLPPASAPISLSFRAWDMTLGKSNPIRIRGMQEVEGLLVTATGGPSACSDVCMSRDLPPLNIRVANQSHDTYEGHATVEWVRIGDVLGRSQTPTLATSGPTISLHLKPGQSVALPSAPASPQAGMYQLQVRISSGLQEETALLGQFITGLTPESEILAHSRATRPLASDRVDINLADRIGATHYAGRYYLTDEPFLLEGAKALHQFGLGVAKFWFSAGGLPGYAYNSQWPYMGPGTRLLDLAQMPYFRQAFAMPFSTFVLETATTVPNRWRDGSATEAYYQQEEAQFYELARYLLTEYADRDVTFILQNWEGDWLLRGRDAAAWETLSDATVAERIQGMIRWVQTRQSGVERARQEVPGSKARVFHALEVNKVWDAYQGIPTVTTHVLPHVTVDLVSYSCYDALDNLPISLWRAIEIIQAYARPSAAFGNNNVYIGEIGFPESGRGRKETLEWWDTVFGALIALDVPYIIQWELYCNEPKDGSLKQDGGPTLSTEDLRGFWLIRPDGQLGYAGEYMRLLAGKDTTERFNPAGLLPDHP